MLKDDNRFLCIKNRQRCIFVVALLAHLDAMEVGGECGRYSSFGRFWRAGVASLKGILPLFVHESSATVDGNQKSGEISPVDI